MIDRDGTLQEPRSERCEGTKTSWRELIKVDPIALNYLYRIYIKVTGTKNDNTIDKLADLC